MIYHTAAHYIGSRRHGADNVIWDILIEMTPDEAEEAIAGAGSLAATWRQWREEV